MGDFNAINQYGEHSNGYLNFREFFSRAKQSTSLMKANHMSSGIYECTNGFQQHSFENGHANGYYGDEYVNRNLNKTSNANANALPLNGNELFSIETQFNGQCRYSFEDSSPNNRQFVASHPLNIPQNHADDIPGQEISNLNHGTPTDTFKNTIDMATLQSKDSLKQTTETIQEHHHNIETVNKDADDLLYDSNYKLVMEAIVQLENDNKIDQQTVITTTIDTSQMDTSAREHSETVLTHQTFGNGIRDSQTSASEQSSNQKQSQSKETLNVPASRNGLIRNERDHTKRAGKHR